jgi:hypothetical protein
MALLELKRDPSEREVRLFGLAWLPLFCAALAGATWYRGDSGSAAWLSIAVGLLSVAVTLIRPSLTRALFLAWMWAAWPIGWLVSHAMMAAIYFLVITPIGLAMRVFGRDPLERRFEPGADSYWLERKREIDPARYFRQF